MIIYIIIVGFILIAGYWWFFHKTNTSHTNSVRISDRGTQDGIKESPEYALLFYSDKNGQETIWKNTLDYIGDNGDRGKCTIIVYDADRHADQIPDEVTSFPTLYFHTPDRHIKYDGDFNVADMVQFIKDNNNGAI